MPNETSAESSIENADVVDTQATTAPNPDVPGDREADFAHIMKKFGAAGWAMLIWMLFPLLGSVFLLTYLKTVGEWVKSNGDSGIWIYIAGVAIATGIAILPTYACAVLAGWAFGMIFGLPAAMVAILGGALVGYTLSAVFFRKPTMSLITSQPKWAAIHGELVNANWWRTLLIVTLIRVAPNSPFAACNIIMGAARVPLLTYAVAIIGMIPRTALTVYIGAGAEEAIFRSGFDWRMFAITIAVSLVVVFVIQHYAKKALEKLTETQETAA